MGQLVKREEGKTYGYWKVLAFYDIKDKNARWLCECTHCKGQYPVYGFALRNGKSKHCRRCNGKGLE